MSKLLSIFGLCLFGYPSLSVLAQNACPNDEIWYTSVNEMVVIPRQTGSFGANIVSNTYENGKGVIKFDSDVTSIGLGAYASIHDLSTITIPNSVTSIGSHAFYYCINLSSVTIPESVTSIGQEVFLGCSNISSMIVDAGNCKYDSREDCNAIIETETNSLISGCMNSFIPKSVTAIGNKAFSTCSNLSSIVIPNSVTSIGDNAFYGCTSMESISIPGSVTRIGNQAFFCCVDLSSIYIPKSVTEIGNSAFLSCQGLTSIVVEEGNPVYDSREDCNAIIWTSYNIMMLGCKNTIIPNSVTKLTDNAFSYCTGLTSIEIPNSISNIGPQCFMGCSNLSSVYIPESVTDIGISAFQDCSGLNSIVVDEDNPVYDSREQCNALINTEYDAIVTGCCNTVIPNTVKSINSEAFRNCTNLTSVIIPESVTYIGLYAFEGCTNLKKVYVNWKSPWNVTCSNAFDLHQEGYSSYIEATLYIPQGSYGSYDSNDWGKFRNILEWDPTGVNNSVISLDKGVYYNLSGQQVSESQKGIMIHLGQKVLHE